MFAFILFALALVVTGFTVAIRTVRSESAQAIKEIARINGYIKEETVRFNNSIESLKSNNRKAIALGKEIKAAKKLGSNTERRESMLIDLRTDRQYLIKVKDSSARIIKALTNNLELMEV